MKTKASARGRGPQEGFASSTGSKVRAAAVHAEQSTSHPHRQHRQHRLRRRRLSYRPVLVLSRRVPDWSHRARCYCHYCRRYHWAARWEWDWLVQDSAHPVRSLGHCHPASIRRFPPARCCCHRHWYRLRWLRQHRLRLAEQSQYGQRSMPRCRHSQCRRMTYWPRKPRPPRYELFVSQESPTKKNTVSASI
jgi:hypothetical protein